MRTSFRPLRTPAPAALASVLAGCLLPLTMLAGAAPAHAEPPAASVPLLDLMASLCPDGAPIARVVQVRGETPGPGLLAAVEQTWVDAGGSRWPSRLASSVATDLRGVLPWVCPPLRAAPVALPSTAALPLTGREAEPEAVPDHLSSARTYLGHSAGLARHAAADRPPPAVPQVVAPWIAASTAPPAAARAWGGGPAGCTGTDPTSGGGCLTGVARHGLDAVSTAFGSLQGGPVVHTASCWDAHAWNPSSDHPRGRACDLFPTTGGTFPQGQELANGWRLAEWLRANAGPLRVSYLIWQGRYWDPSVTDSGGWGRAYRSSVYDVHDATGGHFDHVHVSFAP